MVAVIASPELAVERVLRERASAARSRYFAVPLAELLRAAGLGPFQSHLLLDVVLDVSARCGYKLVRVYAKRGCSFPSSLNGVKVLKHSRSLLVFAKARRAARRAASAAPAQPIAAQ